VKLEDAVALLQARRFAEAEAALKAQLVEAPADAQRMELLGVAIASQGRAQDALAWFDRSIAARPGSASALHNRARARMALGRAKEARADLEDAVALKPQLVPAWTELGGVMLELGDARGAEQAYRRAVELRPDHGEAHYNFGVFLQRVGRAAEAVDAYRRALAMKPAFPAALNNLGNVLRALGRHDEAGPHYARALELEPDFAEAHSNWGASLREAGRVDEAIPHLERALALKPTLLGALNNLGIAYFARFRAAEAIACYRRALAIDPGAHEVLTNLGNALASQGEQAEAERCYRRVIELQPRRADAYNNLALLLQERDDTAGALAGYERALALDPAHADAMSNMGFLLESQGRRDEAMSHYRRALEANPRLARAAQNLGLAHLFRGEFAEGWELVEQRFDTIPPVTPRRPLPQPRFEAADFGHGHRIALWREQGVGDQLLHATLVPELAGRGEDFVLEVDARLVPAFARTHPAWKVVSIEDSGSAFAACDRQLPLGSLARLVRRDAASFIRQPRALLKADPDRGARYRAELGAPGRVVGISWRSFQPKARGRLQRDKSAPLEAFGALARRPGVRLLDLQYGDTADERNMFARAGFRLERLEGLDLFGDLEGVMAAIDACDVVVTTSNVTAHLAGAVGKRTLLVYLRGAPPFHYWAPASDGRSLWYPSIEIVSGPAIDTWERALAQVDERLAA
jgi:tetratricopeptide (TPR) repeat protein